MKTIVTGGTGFLGQALVRELLAAGHSVTAIVRPGSHRRGNLSGLPGLHLIDATLQQEIALPEPGYDVFYCLAWEGGRNDMDTQFPNVENTLHSLWTAAKYGCRRFICTGSQAEYGEKREEITELTPVDPTTSYGAAKVAAYYLTRDLALRLGIEHTWVRVFSVYGEHDNPNTLYTGLLTALRSGNPFVVQTDGAHMWNFLHETDAARALRMLGEAPAAEGVFNLASRENRPLREYVEALRAATNPQAVITFGSQKSRVNLYTTSEKLRRLIGEYERTVFPYWEGCGT